jgi:hypothetical protein
VSLELYRVTADTVKGILENCPSLQHVRLFGLVDDNARSLENAIKDRLKRLASLKINGVAVRLGTDWHGY